MKHKSLNLLTAILFGTAFSAAGLNAQNTFFNAGDLILYFQKPGDDDTIYVGLGSAATLYRGAEAGPTADRQALNIVNINAALTTAYGAGWASDTEIYAGLAACRSTSTGVSVIDGDQTRTLYASRARNGVGTVGQRNSTAWDLTNEANNTGAATSIANNLANDFEANHLTQVAIAPVAASKIDDTNPFSSPGLQGTAFGAFVGGVQQRGGSASFGTFGPAGSVEFALDLNRITSRPDSETTGEVAGVRFIGSYEGTIVVGKDGDVSFITQGPASAPYTTWIDSFNPPLTNPADRLETADPDGDGATNLEEFGFGGNPASGSDSGNGQALTVDADGNSQKDITLTLEVRSGATFSPAGNDLISQLIDGVAYRIEGSPDLVNWDSAVSEVSPLGSGSPSPGYVFKTFRLNAGEGLSGKGFLRAAVTK